MVPQFVMEFAGWLPGVIFPGATALQFYKIWKERTAKGVSIPTWVLFAFANVGLYVYAQKYDSLQMIVGLLGTAALDAAIAVLALARERKERRGAGGIRRVPEFPIPQFAARVSGLNRGPGKRRDSNGI